MMMMVVRMTNKVHLPPCLLVAPQPATSTWVPGLPKIWTNWIFMMVNVIEILFRFQDCQSMKHYLGPRPPDCHRSFESFRRDDFKTFEQTNSYISSPLISPEIIFTPGQAYRTHKWIFLSLKLQKKKKLIVTLLSSFSYLPIKLDESNVILVIIRLAIFFMEDHLLQTNEHLIFCLGNVSDLATHINSVKRLVWGSRENISWQDRKNDTFSIPKFCTGSVHVLVSQSWTCLVKSSFHRINETCVTRVTLL